MDIFLILSIVLVVISGIAVFTSLNLLKKLEAYEDVVSNQAQYVKAVGDLIEASNKHLAKLDADGIFKSDDEVGYFFNTLVEIQKNLDQFNIPENYGQKKGK